MPSRRRGTAARTRCCTSSRRRSYPFHPRRLSTLPTRSWRRHGPRHPRPRCRPFPPFRRPLNHRRRLLSHRAAQSGRARAAARSSASAGSLGVAAPPVPRWHAAVDQAASRLDRGERAD